MELPAEPHRSFTKKNSAIALSLYIMFLRTIPMGKADESKNVNFKVIGDPLHKLLIALGNKLSREWPAKYRNVTGARELFVMHVRIAHLTYLSALYLCGDIPPDPRRKPEFYVSLPVLNRSLLDSLFTVIFILEDVPSRSEWFWEADWKETRLELDRYTAEYGHLPEWQTWLEQLTEHSNNGIAHAKISPTQAAKPKALRSWLNPGAMSNHEVSPTTPLLPVRDFMKFLNDYFYIDLSQQAHLGGWGMIKRAGFVLDEIQNRPETDAQLKKQRYAHIGQTVAFTLSIASEIEAHFDFGLRTDALYIWGVAAPSIVAVEEMYQKRYRELLRES
jgi:hypothetical protein